jgi:hypothetical protein
MGFSPSLGMDVYVCFFFVLFCAMEIEASHWSDVLSEESYQMSKGFIVPEFIWNDKRSGGLIYDW